MNKKMMKGFVLLGIGITLGIVGLVFLSKASGTSLLYANSTFGLYYNIWPVLLLLAILFGGIGIKNAKKNYVKQDRPVKVKPPKPVHVPVAAGPAASHVTQVSFVFCAKCGQRNDGNDKFCAKCGQPL